MFRLLFALAVATAAVAQPKPANWGQRPQVTFDQAAKTFANPDMAYAPFMFWFWDEPLNTAKMTEMARVMTEQGFAPGYAHARRSMVGTPDLPDAQWLGEPWFSAFSGALGQAEQAKTYLGYCDEYWWPSMQANGRVVKQHPELAATSLACETLDVRAGQTVKVPQSFYAVAARLAQPLGAAPLTARLGHWVWHPDRVTSEGTVWFATGFELPAGQTITAAAAQATADNAYKLYLDGREVGGGDVWMTPQSFDLTGKLTPGRHTLTVEARNLDGPAALNVGLAARLADGREIRALTDGTWRARLDKPAGWPRADLAAPGWVAVRDLGESTAAPYHLAATSEEQATAIIDAGTLKVIGDGAAFDWQAPADGDQRVYVFTQYHAPGVDGGGVNYIDERLAPAFTQIALEPYAKRYGDKLGRSIPGDFIDNEGDYGRGLAWSETLERHFAQRFGRDMRALMPLMIDRDTRGAEKRLRYEWFEAVSDCYAATFRAVTDWHEKRGMYTTAHFWEEGLQPQLNAVGDHLKMLRALTMPGQDCLGDKAIRVHDFKEAVSVAEFEGTRAMSEVLGAGGWGTFNPTFLKQALNAMTAWGVAHQIPHGVFAARKMDGNPWMPDWYSDSPMYPMMHHYADFARRSSYLNSVGHAVPDVLLYNPLESVWANANAGLLDKDLWSMPETSAAGRRINEINRVYAQAIDELAAGRIEFLVGDRHYVGQMTIRDGKLRRGDFAFSTVVLPPLDLITGAVAEKMLAFARAGGHVVALGELPTASAEHGGGDARLALVMAELRRQKTFHASAGSVKPLMAGEPAWLCSPVRIVSGTLPLLQAHRRIGGRDVFWLANNTTSVQRLELQFRGLHGGADVWNPEDGSRHSVVTMAAPAGARVALVLQPLEGLWLSLDPTVRQGRPETRPSPPDAELAKLSGPWTVRCVAADQPRLEHPQPVPADLLAGCVKPLEDWKAWGLARFSGRLDYTCEMDAPKVDGSVYLDLGRVAAAAQVWVNGQSVGDRLWGPYRFDVSKVLRPGRNTVRIRVANLINNSYGDLRESGLLGPVRLLKEPPAELWAESR
ncbi:MAG: hypothetical protein HZB16_23475 [Armatimonadetes bacterium]|nr:hypothetical protein [Armatimonadota bacterium]